MSLAEYEDFVFRAGLLHEADPVAAWKRVSGAAATAGRLSQRQAAITTSSPPTARMSGSASPE